MRVVALTLSLLILAGCAGAAATTQTALAISGQSLVELGHQFVAVGGLYTANCTPTVKVASLAGFCSGFKEYAPKFQASYPIAKDAWKFAVQANDASKAQVALQQIVELSTVLTGLAGQAAVALGGN